jgi:hypothetical protein
LYKTKTLYVESDNSLFFELEWTYTFQ